MPFNSTKTLKFKTKQTIAVFTAVNQTKWIKIYMYWSQPTGMTFDLLKPFSTGWDNFTKKTTDGSKKHNNIIDFKVTMLLMGAIQEIIPNEHN